MTFFEFFVLITTDNTNLDHRYPDPGPEDDGDTVEEEDASDGGDYNEPEPEEDVDLLVDDVEGQNAETVMPFRGAAWPELVETAFGNLKQTISLSIRE